MGFENLTFPYRFLGYCVIFILIYFLWGVFQENISGTIWNHRQLFLFVVVIVVGIIIAIKILKIRREIIARLLNVSMYLLIGIPLFLIGLDVASGRLFLKEGVDASTFGAGLAIVSISLIFIFKVIEKLELRSDFPPKGRA